LLGRNIAIVVEDGGKVHDSFAGVVAGAILLFIRPILFQIVGNNGR
jgi:hypothetical protein